MRSRFRISLPRGAAWIVPIVVAIAGMAYAFALDTVTGRWQAFAAIPLWGGAVAVAIVACVVRGVHAIVRACCALLAIGAIPLARLIEPSLHPLASYRDSVGVARERVAEDSIRRAHERLLREAFSRPQRVVRVVAGRVILDGAYVLRVDVKNMHSSTYDRYQAALSTALVGRAINVALIPEFRSRYISSMHSDAGLPFLTGPGRQFGDIPAEITLDGRRLVGWTDSVLVWTDVR